MPYTCGRYHVRPRSPAETAASVFRAGAAFTLSGFAALVDQVVWQRLLALFSGIHPWSTTVIVTAFMAGLGFGSLAGGRIADRLAPPASARVFAACELLEHARSVKIVAITPDDPRETSDINTDLFPRDEFDWRLDP